MKKGLAAAMLACAVVTGTAACGSAEEENARGGSGNDASEEARQEDSQHADASEGLQPAQVQQEDSQDEEESSTAGNEQISVEDGQKLLTEAFGTEDGESGYPYSFDYTDTFTLDGTEYYGYTWSWQVEGGHFSKLADLLVQTDGSAVYEGGYDGENWEVNSENMLDGNSQPGAE